jgi:hypothetical protein
LLKGTDSGLEPLRCSFCDGAQNRDAKLISNPSGSARVYICEECVQVCLTIIEDQRADTEVTKAGEERRHPMLDHPLASKLMDCVVAWIGQESLGQPAPEQVARLRDVATRMVASLAKS